MFRRVLAGAMLLIGLGMSAQDKDADRAWMEGTSWNNGWNVKVHPSVNATEFADQYRKNKEVWDTMFRYLASVDLDTLSIGRVDLIPGRVWVKMSEYEPRTAENVNIEQHHNFIDLQYTLSGNELMGYAHDVTVKNEYNPKKDVAHYNSSDVTYHKAGPEAFYLFFPSDYHQPSVRGEGDVVKSRKLVCKIEYIP